MEKRYKWIIGLLFLGIMTFSLYLLPANTVHAADYPIQVLMVDYYSEEIEVFNSGNSKIYYATEVNAARGSWEEMSVDNPYSSKIDISWLSDTMENILVIKGDKSSNEVRVKLVKKPAKLNITIDYTNMKNLNKNDNIASLVNIMTDAGTGANPITFNALEWRKGINGQWMSTDLLTVNLLEKFLMNGANLYFRIKAVPDEVTYNSSGEAIYPDGTKGRRFSSEVKVKIPKQLASASYDVDGSKLAVEIKYGKEYRISMNGGEDFSAWVQVTDKATKSLSIADMLKATNHNPLDIFTGIFKDNEFPAMIIEIRDYATAKAPASKITRINIKGQYVLEPSRVVNGSIGDDPVSNNDNIYISYNGDKNLIIQIPSASSAKPFEYCVVKKGETLDLKKASWTSITKGTEVKVPATKAVQGGTLYVRMKEITTKQDKTSDEIIIASTCVTHEINYPTIPSIAKASFTYIKKHSDDITFNINLGSTPYETSVKEIRLGTMTIDFTPVSLSANELEIILKKESLDLMPNCSNKYIYIYFDKGTVDKISIKLTIQNPTPAGNLAVSSAKGSDIGTTSITMVLPKGANNTWSYVIDNRPIEEVYTQNKIASVTPLSPTPFTDKNVNNISVNVGDYLTIFETDKDGYILKYKCIKITSEMIKTE